MKEIWRIINLDELDKVYSISSFGEIKNNKTDKISIIGYDDRRPRKIPTVRLKNLTGSKIYKLEYLMAITFLNSDDNIKKLCHLNGSDMDCKLTNLAWMTPVEITQNNIRLGIIKEIELLHYDGLEKEIWKEINWIPTKQIYMISSYGRVLNSETYHIIKPFKDDRNNNYMRVRLYLSDGNPKNFSLSRLIARGFINDLLDEDISYYLDGNPENNYYKNIAIGTKSNMYENYFNNTRMYISNLDYEDEEETWITINMNLYYSYSVSSYGRVYNHNHGRLLSQCDGACNNSGQHWKFVNLRMPDGTFVKFLVHRLVSLEFYDNPKNKPHVNHLDGNPERNYYKNLEWATVSENVRHALDNNLLIPRKGEEISSIWKDKEIHKICELLSNGMSATEVFKYINVTNFKNVKYPHVWGLCHRIKQGKDWKHISKDYNIYM